MCQRYALVVKLEITKQKYEKLKLYLGYFNQHLHPHETRVGERLSAEGLLLGCTGRIPGCPCTNSPYRSGLAPGRNYRSI